MSSPNGFSFTFQHPDLDDCAVATKGSVRVQMTTRVYSPEKKISDHSAFLQYQCISLRAVSKLLWVFTAAQHQCRWLYSEKLLAFWKTHKCYFYFINQHITIIGKWEIHCCIDQTGSTSSNAKAALPFGGKSPFHVCEREKLTKALILRFEAQKIHIHCHCGKKLHDAGDTYFWWVLLAWVRAKTLE